MGNPVKKTMLFALLDCSGSMAGMEADVVGSINTFAEEQKKLPDPAVFGVAVFSSETEGMIKIIRPMVDLKEFKPLTRDSFAAIGGTPLLDATGKAIQTLDADWLREKPDRCVFVTFTDGMENASKEFNKDQIKSMIQSRERSGLWQFLFLGANIDAFSVGSAMGYTSNKMSNYVGSSIGTKSAIHRMSESVGTLRSASSEVFANVAAGSGDIGLGGDIAEDGTISKGTDGLQKGYVDKPVSYGANAPAGNPWQLGSIAGGPINSPNPPLASLKPEDWAAQQSSALFDPKEEAWKPPV